MSLLSLEQSTMTCFAFLFNRYGFVHVKSSGSDQYMGNARVVLSSRKVIVEIVCDRSQVVMRLGPVGRSPEHLFDLFYILIALKPSVEPNYLFMDTTTGRVREIEDQVCTLAAKVRDHLLAVFENEFSDWEAVARVEQEYVLRQFGKTQ